MQNRHYYVLIITFFIAGLALIFTTNSKSDAGAPVVLQPPFLTTTPIGTPTPLPTPTPLITPSPTPLAPGCDPGSFNIQVGSTVTIRPGVNIRSAPGRSNPSLAYFTENLNFTVIDGPVCENGYFWWRVSGHSVVGWVAERSSEQDFIRFIFPPVGDSICAEPLPLELGEVIELANGVRIREEAGRDGLVLTVAPIDTPVTVLSNEAVCVDNYNWRLVSVVVAGFEYEGYMAEGTSGTPSEFFVEFPTPDPDTVCNTPMGVNIGDRRRVRYEDGIPKALRAVPGTDGELLFTLVEGVPFEIVGGPVCASGQNYWLIRILSNIPATGWFPEGPRPNYWSEPFTSDNAYPPIR